MKSIVLQNISDHWPRDKTFQQHKLTVLAPCSTSIDLYRSSMHADIYSFSLSSSSAVSICLFLPSNHLLFLTCSIYLPSYCSISTSLFRSFSVPQTPSIHLVHFLSTDLSPSTAPSFSRSFVSVLYTHSLCLFLPGSLLSFNWLPGGCGNFVFWLNTHTYSGKTCNYFIITLTLMGGVGTHTHTQIKKTHIHTLTSIF